MNEEALIEALLDGARQGGATLTSSAVRLGPGDDAAVLAPPPGQELAWTVDDHIEGIHFRRAWGLEAIGRKAAGAALSDLAAMGATPLGALLALHLPAELLSDTTAVARLARGFGRTLAEAGCPLAGGNVARHPTGLSLSTSALGAVPEGRALRRDAARAGDLLLVGGRLGQARLELAWLESGRAGPTDLAAALLAPTPRFDLVPALLALPRAACLDLSDGLARDLPRLLRASGVAAVVDSAALPLPDEALAARLGLDPREAAWLGGEDYALLVAAPGPVEGFTTIGRVVAGPPGLVTLEGPLVGRQLGPGFDHVSG